jgi:hypothetical protein
LLLAALLALSGCSLTFRGTPTPQILISGAPVITIAAPLEGSTYLEGVSVIIQALVANAGADIARVNIQVDGETIADLQTPNSAGLPQFSLAQGWGAHGVGQHTIMITAYRADGSASAPSVVTFNVTNSADQVAGNADTTEQTAPPGPATVPAATSEDAPPSDTSVMATVNQPSNVRSGPASSFNPPIGSLNAGDTVELVARTSAGDWYRLVFEVGDGWINAIQVTPQGDVSALPVDDGPPRPNVKFSAMRLRFGEGRSKKRDSALFS